MTQHLSTSNAHGVVVAEGYSFNYNLVDDDEQAQKPDESFSDYQIRLLGLVSTTLNSGNIRSYYDGIDGESYYCDELESPHHEVRWASPPRSIA